MLPRSVSLFWSLTLLLSVFFFTKSYLDQSTAVIATALLAFEPNILAFGHLATTEIPATLSYFFTIAMILKYLQSPSKPKLTLFWISIGILASTKTILLLSVLLFIVLLFSTKPKRILSLFSLPGITLAAFIIWAIHGFALKPPIDSFPPLPLGEFIRTSLRAINYTVNSKFDQTRSLVYFGNVSGVGWFSYPLVSILLKTSPQLLLLFLYSLLKPQVKLKPLYFASLTVLITVTLGRYSTGVRHLLSAYPFIAIAAASDFRNKDLKHKLILKIIIFSMILFTTLGTKDPLAYFNPFIGSQIGGNIISASNLDWGQSLDRLANESKLLKIDYIAETSPQHPQTFGLSAQPLPRAHLINKNFVKDKTLAISRTSWYTDGFYQNKTLNSQKPLFAANNTFYIFKF